MSASIYQKAMAGFRSWLSQGLVRRTTAQVAATLLAIIALTAMVSFFSTWYLVREQKRQELDRTAEAVAHQFEAALADWAGAIGSLARNRVLSNALLDSKGRDQYLIPFLREYDMRIDELLSLSLCDYLGRPLASTGVGDARCYGERPDFRARLAGRQALSFLSTEGGHLLLVLVVPVIYPMTNSAEGALVGRLDLTTWFERTRHVPSGYHARLHVAARPLPLLGSDQSMFGPPAVRKPRLPAPLDSLEFELQVGRSEASSPAEIGKLFFAHGIAALLLLVLGIFYARQTARRMSEPLLALVETARGIADGNDNLRADAGRQDEIGQLARDFNRMVDRLEASNANLEGEVMHRTAELLASERRERRRSRELAAILDAMPALVMTASTADCQRVQINRALRRLLPPELQSGDEPVGLGALKRLDFRHFGTPLAFEDWPLVKAAREGVEISDFACEAGNARGELIHLIGNALPIKQDGYPAGAIAVFTDVTKLRRAEADVQEQEERYHRLFDLMPEGLCVSDGDLVQLANATLASLTGFDNPEELVGQHVLSFVHLDDRPSFSATLHRLREGSVQPTPLPFRLIRRDGSHLHAEIVSSMLQLGGRRVVQSIVRDVSLRRKADEQTRLAARVFESSQEGIFITDAEGRIISVNPAYTVRTGYRTEDVLGLDPRQLSAGLHDDAYFAAMWHALATAGHWEGEIHNRHKDGGLLAQWISISAVRDEDGGLQHYIAVLSDISERKVSVAHMAYLAQHDYLTGLPNRLLLRDRLGQALNAAKRGNHQVAVLFADLDGFKAVNDTYGHAVGDQLLRQVAHRIKGQLRAMDSVCRHGGDEFVVLLVELEGAAAAATVAAKLCAALSRPYAVGTLKIATVSISIGIAIYPADGEKIDQLLERADQAMYRAKRSGKNAFVCHGDPKVEAAVMCPPAIPTLH